MAKASRFAVIDIGSNTVHLLIADSDGRAVVAIDDQSTALRLGEDVARAGAFDPQKIELTTATVRGYVSLANRTGARDVLLLGTQAVRAAANGKDLADRVAKATSLPMKIIPPQIEAELGFLGTTLDGPGERPRLIVDIGGGSTQILFADENDETEFLDSLPLGSVTLPAKFLRHDPPRKAEREGMELAIRQGVGSVQHRDAAANPIELGILVGGAGRRLRKAGRLNRKEPLVRLWVERLAASVMSVTTEAMEIFGAIRFDEAGIVRTGALVLREVMGAFDLQYCLVSDYGIREGAVLKLARGEEISEGL